MAMADTALYAGFNTHPAPVKGGGEGVRTYVAESLASIPHDRSSFYLPH